MNQRKIKKPALSQSMIDTPAPSSPDTWRDWLKATPGPWSTILVLIVFALGMWALFAIWGMAEVWKAIATAGRG